MRVRQRNDRRRCYPHDVEKDDRNMGEGTRGLCCRLGLLLLGEGTSGSNF